MGTVDELVPLAFASGKRGARDCYYLGLTKDPNWTMTMSRQRVPVGFFVVYYIFFID